MQKKIVCLVLIAMAALALGSRAGASMEFVRESQRLIDEINSKPTTWKAGFNDAFLGWTRDDLKRLTGTVLQEPSMAVKTMPTKEMELENFEAPDTFDSRQQWPECKSIGEIRNQAECGACWAFGCVEAVTDRYCIASANHSNPILSAQYLTTCDQMDNGCDGGNLQTAWEFVKENGLPTVECQPFTVKSCPPEQQPCLPPFQPTPQCRQECYGNETGPIKQKYYVNDVYSVGGIFGAEKKIQAEIMAHGPIEASMTVYEDFVHYKSGVYQHQSGQALGGHAIKMIGWGEENGTPYWLLANSWTTTWGDQGFFKILRGHDECGIEHGCVAGTVRV